MKDSKRGSYQKDTDKKSGRRPDKRSDRKPREDVTMVEDTKKTEMVTRGHNDLKWLIYNPNYANVVARIPFGKALGSALGGSDYSLSSGGVFGTSDSKWTIPGVATVRGLFTAGRSDDVNSPINVAALNEWIFLRHAGTGSLVDDPNDVAVYFIALGQLLSYLGWLRRLCACLLAENPLNQYARKSLVLTEDLDYEDFRDNQANLIMFTTWFATQLNNFVFPRIPYFEQAYSQFHYIYKDEELAGKAQYYKYSPLQFGILDETTYSTGSAIVYGICSLQGGSWVWDSSAYFHVGGVYTFEVVKQTGLRMLNALQNSQFVATLGAAVLKAHTGTDGLFRVSDIDMLDERLDVTVDPEIAMQFHNMQFYNQIAAEGNVFTYQSVVPTIPSQQSPYLVTDPSFYVHSLVSAPSSGSTIIHPEFNMLDCYSDEPTPAEVLLGSRNLTGVVAYLNAGEIVRDTITHDAFLPLGMSIAYYNYNQVLAQDMVETDYAVRATWTAATVLNTVYPLANACTFTAAPLLKLDIPNSNKVVFGEFHNTVIIPVETLKDIYRNNLLSLFNVPKFK